jgi:TolA-binding protein
MKMIRSTNQSGLVRLTLILLLVSGTVAVAVPGSIARAADQSGAAESSANNPEQNKDVAQQLADLRARVEKLEAEKNHMEPMECCKLGMKGMMGQGTEAPKPEQK